MEENDVTGNEKCANPTCGRKASPGGRYCDNCELEWTLYRRDLREGDREEEGVAVESR
jgi:hypothetical protein